MNIRISDNLKELRKKKNNTQEDLAEFLTVSINAVSKWERGECYPDIELLPKIASYYDISVDDLLGVGEIKKQERIDEYSKKSSHLQNIGDIKANLDLWREAKKEFPNDWNVLWNLMYALMWVESDENRLEAIKVGERILSECTVNSTRYSAMQVLCFEYKKLENLEKAKEYAYMAPSFYVTSNKLLPHVLKGEELIELCQRNILDLCELLGQEIFDYASCRGSIEGDEKKHAYHTAIKVYELIYEDGDFGFYACRISRIYSNLARLSAEQQDKNETLDYIANAVKYAIICDTQEDSKRTSLLVNRMSHNSKGVSKSYMSNDSYLLLKEMEHQRYDFCRDDDRFIKLIENLQKVAVSGE